MSNSIDFRADQIQTKQIIVKNTSPDQSRLLIYGIEAEGTPVNEGVINTTHFPQNGIGTDVFLFVSGAVNTKGSATERGTSVFGGDVVVSGSLYQGWARIKGGPYSFAHGDDVEARGDHSHAEGLETLAESSYCHAEGYGAHAEGYASHAEGRYTLASNLYSHAEGFYATSSNRGAHAEGHTTNASGEYSHTEGHLTYTFDNLVPGQDGYYAHTEGVETSACGDGSHAEGHQTSASGSYSHAEGFYTRTTRNYSHAEGDHTVVFGESSHSEGYYTEAHGSSSHSEGYYAKAYGPYSHAEGLQTKTYGLVSHAEGNYTEASGAYSHAEGSYTKTLGDYSHAQGSGSIACGIYSFAAGNRTIASGSVDVTQAAFGRFNKRNNTTSLFVIGNGTGDSNALRADLFRAESNGVLVLSGGVRHKTSFDTSTLKLSEKTDYLKVIYTAGVDSLVVLPEDMSAGTDSGHTIIIRQHDAISSAATLTISGSLAPSATTQINHAGGWSDYIVLNSAGALTGSNRSVTFTWVSGQIPPGNPGWFVTGIY